MSRSLKAMIQGKEEPRSSSAKDQGNRTTFVVEVLLLLACLMMVIAVSVSVIAYSVQANSYYAHKESAITLGTNIAERFYANPSTTAGEYEEGDLVATCDVFNYRNDGGTMYDASISVTWNESEIFALDTCKYVPDDEVIR